MQNTGFLIDTAQITRTKVPTTGHKASMNRAFISHFGIHFLTFDLFNNPNEIIILVKTYLKKLKHTSLVLIGIQLVFSCKVKSLSKTMQQMESII